MEKPKTPVAWLVHEGQLVTILTEEGQDATAAIKEETTKRGLSPDAAIAGSPPDDYAAIYKAKMGPSSNTSPDASPPSSAPANPVNESAVLDEVSTIPPAANPVLPPAIKPRRRGDNWDRMISGIRTAQKWTTP